MSAIGNIGELVILLEGKAVSLTEKVNELKSENQELKRIIEELSVQKESLLSEVAKWQDRVEALKMANSILGSNENKTQAKLKINALIREIDACIVQLSKS